jgi:hypothetical protein
MNEIFIALLSGILFGMAFGLLAFSFPYKKQIEKERFHANLSLYQQLLLKKCNKDFQYSKSIRKVINRIHATLLVEHQNQAASLSMANKKPLRQEPII